MGSTKGNRKKPVWNEEESQGFKITINFYTVIEYSSNSPFHRCGFLLIKKKNFDVADKWFQSLTKSQF